MEEIALGKLREADSDLDKITEYEWREFKSIADRIKSIVNIKLGSDSKHIQDITDLLYKIENYSIVGLRKAHITQLKGMVRIIIDEIELTMPPKPKTPEAQKIIVTVPYNWGNINVIIQKVAKSRFENGHYADAVEASFKEINDIIKKQYKNKIGSEEDGDSLMRKAFTSTQNNNYVPHFRLADNSTDSGKNVQQGYMDIFAGSMKGIRNPKAHANHNVSAEEAWEMIIIASHLMRMWEKHN